jgi:nucleoside-diphosphate kinase
VAGALVIFKPDGSHRLAVRAGLWSWLSGERSWTLESLAWWRPPAELIEEHYDFLRGRPFFPWLVDFMSALPLLVGRVTASAAGLEEMRHDLGETRIAESRPGSLRERYGIFGGINCLHVSDSPEAGRAELALWSRHLALDGVLVQLETSSKMPDHTYRLRSLANQVAAGQHALLAGEAMRQLLRSETDLDEAGYEALCRVILGALV